VPAESFNIAQFLPAMASSAPDRPAVICEHSPDSLGRTALSFKKLNADSDRLAWGLSRSGLKMGQRTLVLVPPGLDFISLTFALFKVGAVPVLIDPGMGKKNLLDCIKQVRPEAFIGISLGHALRVLKGSAAFSEVKLNVTVGRRWFWGGKTLAQIRELGESREPFALAPTTNDSPAAILFTTGSTGIPKGVCYKHGMFGAQVVAIRTQYGIEPGEIDLPAFPLFALFSTALGTTCIIPEMDPTRPAQCDPEKIVRAIQKHKVTYTFGSPSIWKRVGPYCLEKNISLPSLKRILMAGAPVRREVLAPFAKILNADADTHIPYGATESLPVCSIRGSEVLRETWELTRQGKGHCVGKPLPGNTVRIIRPDEFRIADCGLPNGPVDVWDDSRVLPPGEIGEIVVKGNVVTHEYFEMPEQTQKSKIYEVPGSRLSTPDSRLIVWHRMGDMGYFDAQGRLWFCGRKAHRVIMDGGKVLYSVCVEAIFESAFENLFSLEENAEMKRFGWMPRTALVGVTSASGQRPIIIFEDCLKPPHSIYVGTQKILKAVSNNALVADISYVQWYPKSFPVDIRHNAKINREELARWAEKQLSK
jgi:acyl-CoA synthetase (AMP-forming)/AMP-acid ligase II